MSSQAAFSVPPVELAASSSMFFAAWKLIEPVLVAPPVVLPPKFHDGATGLPGDPTVLLHRERTVSKVYVKR